MPADGPAQRVGAAARRVRHHDADGSARPVGLGLHGDGQQCRGDRGKQGHSAQGIDFNSHGWALWIGIVGRLGSRKGRAVAGDSGVPNAKKHFLVVLADTARGQVTCPAGRCVSIHDGLRYDKKPQYRSEVERYSKEKGEIKIAADKLEAEAKSWDGQSDAQMHLHHRWAQATTALQVSIAMAAIALLTKRKWLEWVMYGMASIGLVLGGAAVLHL
ncbi:MAG: DUF4337 family protein [Rubrivivax sp.]